MMTKGPITGARHDRARIVLVTAPTLAEHADGRVVRDLLEEEGGASASPPLGTLVVAALFRQSGWSVSVVDSNREYLEHLDRAQTQSSFARSLSERLARQGASTYGFSTVCGSYPLSLRVAEHLKELAPRSLVVFGGPQASATAADTLRSYPCVDFVIRGEVEGAVGPFGLYHASAPEAVPGLCWRDVNGIRRNPWPLPPDAASIPFPAYDLCPLHETDVAYVEAGRGCPFGCRFCSTSSFFGRSHRLRSPAAIIDDVLRLREAYGVRKVAFVHDNLFLDGRQCEAFCAAWTADRRLEGVSWSCSLRPDAVTPAMARALSRSGCTSVFVGLESGSRRMQHVIGKHVDLGRGAVSLSALHTAGVRTVTAFIIGFPEETDDDLRQTCAWYLRVLRAPLATPLVYALTVLARSGYDVPSEWPLEFGGPISSLAHQGSSIPSDLLTSIVNSPTLFSSHYGPRLRHLDRSFVSECEHFLNYTTALYRWLVVMMAHCLGDDLPRLLGLWWTSVGERARRPSLYDYFSGPAFRRDFDEFATTLPGAPGFSSGCVDQYRFLLDVYRHASDDQWKLAMRLHSRRARPFEADGTIRGRFVLRDVGYSFAKLTRALARGRGVGDLDAVPSRLLCYFRGGRPILEEPTPLTVAILERVAVNGRLVPDLVAELSDTRASLLPAGVRDRREEAFTYAVQDLCGRGVLVPVGVAS